MEVVLGEEWSQTTRKQTKQVRRQAGHVVLDVHFSLQQHIRELHEMSDDNRHVRIDLERQVTVQDSL